MAIPKSISHVSVANRDLRYEFHYQNKQDKQSKNKGEGRKAKGQRKMSLFATLRNPKCPHGIASSLSLLAMTKMKLITLLCFFASLFLCFSSAATAWERSTPNVPPDSYLYRDLDKLVALGLVHPPILGQKPYTRSAFARLTAEAMKNYEEQIKVEDKVEEGETLKKFVKRRARERQIEIVIDHLKAEFKKELIDIGAIEGEKKEFRVHPLDEFITYITYLDSPAATIPVSDGRGLIEADINPLGDYNLGRHAIDGFQQAEEFTGWFEATKFMSGYVRPRFEVDIPSDATDMSGHVYVQNAYATFAAGNFNFEFGRDSMAWGIGDRGGLLFSTNPRPMDGIRVTNPKPARLPWIFKYLGEWRYTLFGYNLGPEQVRKWDWLAGYKFSLSPTRYIELGFGHVVMIGGEGAPNPSFLEVLGEFTGFRPAGTDPSVHRNVSNHIFEIEYLLRIVPLRNMQIYGDISIDDKWKSIKKTLIHGCSYIGGVYLPAVNPSGSADLRVEFVKTSALQYRHYMFADGYTLNRKLIGTDAGPDAYNLHTIFRHTISPKVWYGFSLDWDYRRSDTYTELTNPDGTVGDIVKIATGPAESRYRGVAELDLKFKKYNTLHLTGGYERVLNSQFRQGVDRNNFLMAASLNLNLDRYFGFNH